MLLLLLRLKAAQRGVVARAQHKQAIFHFPRQRCITFQGRLKKTEQPERHVCADVSENLAEQGNHCDPEQCTPTQDQFPGDRAADRVDVENGLLLLLLDNVLMAIHDAQSRNEN